MAQLLILLFVAGLKKATTQQQLVNDILNEKTYDPRVKPTRQPNGTVKVDFRLDLYQIIQVNEPQQFIQLNAWVSESWSDELLFWEPEEYQNITEINLPHHGLWKPDTILYNTLVMKDEEARRLLNVKLTVNTTTRSVMVDMLYPTIFTFSCSLFLIHFPFDEQNCSMTFGSWTYDAGSLDYFPIAEDVGLWSYLENEGWTVISFKVYRHTLNYSCCPHPWTNLKYHLNIKRKPLFYIVNLIIPTIIITLISIVGFFMPSTATGERHEKVSLGITTLLSMSILLLMVSHEMPTTSSFIPLIGWFYLSMIIVISTGTIMSSVVIVIQKKGQLGERLPKQTACILKILSKFFTIRMPDHLRPHRSTGRPKYEEKKSDRINWNSVLWVAKKRQAKNVFVKHENESGTNLIEAASASSVSNAKTSDARPNGVRPQATGNATSMKHILMDSKQKAVLAEKEQRVFAAREYAWFASLIERICFVIFLSILGSISVYLIQRSIYH